MKITAQLSPTKKLNFGSPKTCKYWDTHYFISFILRNY